jgi:hypothetical protein
MKLKLLGFLLAIVLLGACRVSHPACQLSTGDLIFIRDTTGMGQAIAQSTGQYTHVAIAQCTDSGLFVVEALPRRGVIRRPYIAFAHDYAYPLGHQAAFYRITCPYDTAYLNQQLQNLIGQPYDDYFLPENGRLYCSELVYECFRDSLGTPLFHAQPMNFLAPDGSLPAYWQHLFDSLSVAVPQGVPGTNPTNLSQEPILCHVSQ